MRSSASPLAIAAAAVVLLTGACSTPTAGQASQAPGELAVGSQPVTPKSDTVQSGPLAKSESSASYTDGAPPVHDEQGNSLDQIATDTREGACWHEVFATAAYLADRQIEDTAVVNVRQAIGNQSPIFKIGLRMSSKLLGTGMREGVDAAAKKLAPVIADSCATEGNPFLDAGKVGRLYDLTQSSVLMQITYYG